MSCYNLHDDELVYFVPGTRYSVGDPQNIRRPYENNRFPAKNLQSPSLHRRAINQQIASQHQLWISEITG